LNWILRRSWTRDEILFMDARNLEHLINPPHPRTVAWWRGRFRRTLRHTESWVWSPTQEKSDWI